jgi:transcriptional regulator with XRE-family HTH domain
MNLAQKARAAVATFLMRDFSQPKFANLTGLPVGTIRGWEQGKRIPRGSATHTLLRLIAESPDFMVPALVQLTVSQFLRVDISFELATEIVNEVLRGNKSEEDRKMAFNSIANKIQTAMRTSVQSTHEIIDGMLCRVTVIQPPHIFEKK